MMRLLASKWLSASAVMSVVAGIVPLVLSAIVASGADVGFATPVAWVVGIAALAVLARRKMESTEL